MRFTPLPQADGRTKPRPMDPSQIDPTPERDEKPIAATLFPRPGAFARAFFRCALFASIPVLAAFVLGVVVSSEPLLRAATPLAALLALPLFVLSFAFLRTDRRLACVGFVVLVLLLLAVFGVPIYSV